MKLFLATYLVIVAIMSLITWACYGWDKRQAKQGNRRIPESTLHGLAALGGWPGALLGRNMFRHKTRKTLFTIVTWGIVVCHLGLLIVAWKILS